MTLCNNDIQLHFGVCVGDFAVQIHSVQKVFIFKVCLDIVKLQGQKYGANISSYE